VAGFILAVTCALALARFGEAGEPPQAGTGGQRARRSQATTAV
jgi:hypothetical protein